jgi:hypothetical protein
MAHHLSHEQLQYHYRYRRFEINTAQHTHIAQQNYYNNIFSKFKLFY